MGRKAPGMRGPVAYESVRLYVFQKERGTYSEGVTATSRWLSASQAVVKPKTCFFSTAWEGHRTDLSEPKCFTALPFGVEKSYFCACLNWTISYASRLTKMTTLLKTLSMVVRLLSSLTVNWIRNDLGATGSTICCNRLIRSLNST